LFVKSAPALRSASARAAPSSSTRYMIALAPASPSPTIDLRLSLSSKATTSGGGFNSMRPQDYIGSSIRVPVGHPTIAHPATSRERGVMHRSKKAHHSNQLVGRRLERGLFGRFQLVALATKESLAPGLSTTYARRHG